MTQLRFYFVRHGETEFNQALRVQGQGVDVALNSTGQEQASRVAERLANITFDVAYCSPLLRACQTAEAILQRQPHPLNLNKLSEIAEMSFGQYEGQSIGDHFKPVYEQWQQGVFDIPVEGGGESILDVQRRGLQGIEKILQESLSGTVLVVTHGRFLQVLLASLLPEKSLMEMSEFRHANTGISILTWQDGVFRAEKLGCSAHL